jgi:hypothetical protein
VDGDYTGYELTGAYALTPTTALTVSYSDYKLDLDGSNFEFSGVTRIGVRLGF